MCDYCNKPSSEVDLLVEGPVAEREINGRQAGSRPYICSACIDSLRTMIIQSSKSPKVKFLPTTIPSPRQIVEILDRSVIGQEVAKRTIAVAVVNHYKRLRDQATSYDFDSDSDGPFADVAIEKSNILLIGPTGSGKTLLARALAQILQVPFAIGDATTLTEAGYVGEDVENLILKLLRETDYDVEQAQLGIIFIDEIDKIGKTNQNVSITRDVSGEGVQQSLLKLIEGTVCSVPPGGGRKHPEQQFIQVDTTNILFICGGAFVGLDEIVRKRMGRHGMGFAKVAEDDEWVVKNVTEDDLIEFGLIPEFVGRLPVVSTLKGLDRDAMIRILTEPKDAIVKQYQKICHADEVKLFFTKESLEAIAELALDKGTGARALKSVMEQFMLDIMYDLSEHKGETVIVTKEVVHGEKPAWSKTTAA